MLNHDTLNRLFETAESQSFHIITRDEVENLFEGHNLDSFEYFQENPSGIYTQESALAFLGY